MHTNVICTIATKGFDPIFNLTAVAMKEYADRCDAELYVEQVATDQPFDKYDLFQKMADTDFQRVLYLDANIYCRKTAPNIFHTHKFSGAFSELQHPKQDQVFNAVRRIREQMNPLHPFTSYYHTGVLLFDQASLLKLVRAIERVDRDPSVASEQDQLNHLFHRLSFPDEAISIRWNASTDPDWLWAVKDYKDMHFLRLVTDDAEQFIRTYP